MNSIIIYGSQYGTTQEYALELSRLTQIEAKNYEEIKNINYYDQIIYLGGLYAGGVKGLKQTIKQVNHPVDLIIVTVGLADVTDQENINNIRTNIKRQVPDELLDFSKVFHLRGGIDYRKLNIKHKTMMSLLYQKAKHLPEEKKNAEVKAMIDSYNTVVNFVDFSSLEPIIQLIKGESIC